MLDRAVLFNEMSVHLMTNEGISNDHINQFYWDINDILKEIDPSTHFFGMYGTSKNTEGTYSRIEQMLNLMGTPGKIKCEIRTYSILYRQNGQPNFGITSEIPSFDIGDFVNLLLGLPYVGQTERYEQEILDLVG